MIRGNVPLPISRGIFVCGEMIQMYTTRKRNYTVIKQRHNGDSKAKKTKGNSVYRSHQAQEMGWMYLIIFTRVAEPESES